MPIKDPVERKKYHAAYMRAYYRSTPERMEKAKALGKRYRDRDPEAHRAKKRAANTALKEKVFCKLGKKCNNPNCGWVNEDGSKGCTDLRCLQIDHVYGGGVKEYRTMTTTQIYKAVLADTVGKYQALCANCNWIKRFIVGA